MVHFGFGFDYTREAYESLISEMEREFGSTEKTVTTCPSGCTVTPYEDYANFCPKCGSKLIHNKILVKDSDYCAESNIHENFTVLEAEEGIDRISLCVSLYPLHESNDLLSTFLTEVNIEEELDEHQLNIIRLMSYNKIVNTRIFDCLYYSRDLT